MSQDLLRGVRASAAAGHRRGGAAATVLRALAAWHHPDFHQARRPRSRRGRWRHLGPRERRLSHAARSDRAGRVPDPAGGRARRRRKAPRSSPRRRPPCWPEMFEIQESAGGGARRARWTTATRATLREQREALRARHGRRGARAWPGRSAPAGTRRRRRMSARRPWPRFKEALATRAYLRTVIDDLTEALEPAPSPKIGTIRGPDACRASSALTWARPTAWSRTWTSRPGCPWSSPTARAGRCCRPSWASRPTASWWARRRGGSSRGGRPTPCTRSSG